MTRGKVEINLEQFVLLTNQGDGFLSTTTLIDSQIFYMALIRAVGCMCA